MSAEPLFGLDPDPSLRAPRVRARTVSVKRLSKRDLARGAALYPETDDRRPETRGDCKTGEFTARPCPFVSCKYHLAIDVSQATGAIKLNRPDINVGDLESSCALDIADKGGITLEEVGVVMNLTRERIRQIETKGLKKLSQIALLVALQDDFSDSTAPKGRDREHVRGGSQGAIHVAEGKAMTLTEWAETLEARRHTLEYHLSLGRAFETIVAWWRTGRLLNAPRRDAAAYSAEWWRNQKDLGASPSTEGTES